jgi:integrase
MPIVDSGLPNARKVAVMLRGPYLRTVAVKWVDDVGYRNPTRSSYLRVLLAFDRRAQARHSGIRFCELTPDDVKDFIDVRDDGGRRADRSRKQYTNILWACWDWASAIEIGYALGNPVTRLRAQRRRERRAPQDVIRKTWLGEERAKLLVATTRGDGTDPHRIRDAFILATFLYTGLRLAELHQLRWGDVDLAAGRHGILHVLGKGRKVAQVPLNQAARKLLFEWRSTYITGFGSDTLDGLPVVPRMYSKVVTRVGVPGVQPREAGILWGRPIGWSQSIHHIVATRSLEAGLGHVAPHDLRRSFAGILHDRGVPLEEISRALRHASIETTRVYLEDKPNLAAGFADFDLG